MSVSSNVTVKAYDATEAQQILPDIIIPLWEDIYSETAAVDPFFSTDRFMQRFQGYVRAPGFALRTATDLTGRVAGLTFGYSLPSGSRWWSGLQEPVSDEFTKEDGKRTFAINEIMVIESMRRQGIATALHDRLLSDRRESRATLLVEPENVAARTAYLRWGWTPLGPLQPFPDSPLYESMIITLPISPSHGLSHP
jgi:GNAT superfamily N-acetyltransferase